MPSPPRKQRPRYPGYIIAIGISALGHAALFALVFLVMPAYLHSDQTPPPTYTVKIVDNIPAGDLGTHLPRLAQRARPKPRPKRIARAEEHRIPQEPKIEPLKPPKEKEKAIAIKSLPTRTPTPTPTPAPAVKPVPTPVPTVKPTPKPKRAAKPKPIRKEVARTRPTPAPPKRHREQPRAKPQVRIAKAESPLSVEERLAKIRERLLAEHLEQESEKAAKQAKKPETGGGPVVANTIIAGSGMGIGPGTGSAGIQQDLQFLLYYRTVQEKIKKAWSFPGGPSDLTATVYFAIGPDGSLTAVRVARSSHDPAFDESVIRAIRRAAPFPSPPDKYRSEFAAGIEALFRLGELKSPG